MPRIRTTLFQVHKAWTKTPNILVDRLLPTLKDTELRVLLVVLRSTVGWNRPNVSVFISYKRLKALTGRESAATAKALRSLTDRGLIHRDNQRQVRKPSILASDSEQQTKTRKN